MNHAGDYVPTLEQITRFWNFVSKAGDDACWLWTGSTVPNGYGHYFCGGGRIGAHRFAWIASFGPIPPDMMICHRCDVRLCCRPNHLFLGTASDNQRDMVTKGRQGPTGTPGEGNLQAKLSAEDVLVIRRRRAAGEREGVLAAEFHVDRSHINRIVRKEWWAWL